MSQAALYETAERTLPGAGLGGYSLPADVRFVINDARGARVVSADGREYVDYVCGAGANILGANHPAVVEAVQEQAARGLHFFGTLTTAAIELSDVLVAHIPCAEKIVFTTEPHADVPAYICLPKNATPPYTCVICVQGHSTGMHNSIAVDFKTETKRITVDGDRDFALTAMAQGYAALCIEQRSFGLRLENDQTDHAPGYCHDATMQALMLGRTLIGQRVYDVDRGIDYLAQRGDVNMKHLAIMGNSGGGTISTFAAAALPRIKLAMPSCYFCSFKDSIMAIYHCSCNYIPALYKYAEMSDILGLFAPKPVIIVAGKNDPIFPIKATRQQFQKLKTIYRAAQAENHCQLVVGPGEHRFYADLAWPKLNKAIQKL